MIQIAGSPGRSNSDGIDLVSAFGVGEPVSSVEVVELAGLRIGHEVTEAQGLVYDRSGERGLDSGGGLLEVVHRHAHVHVVRDVDHDPVEEEVEPLWRPGAPWCPASGP